MIQDWIAEYISKYSFVKRYERVGVNWIFYLEDDCAIKSFKINIFRINKKKLIEKINDVKEKIGYNNETSDWKKQIRK